MIETCKLLDGRIVADKICSDIKQQLSNLTYRRPPCLAVLRVGDNPATLSYVSKKVKIAESLSFRSIVKVFNEGITEDQLLREVDSLNANDEVDGILVQAPLPKEINFVNVCNEIDELKDVDGFGCKNFGKLFQGKECVTSCTPSGIIELFKFYQISPEGKHVVIVNRSIIVGKPLAAILLKRNATVTICHSKTKNLKDITKCADILVFACGKPAFFDKSYVKRNAIVIDVGISRIPADNSKGYVLCGDVDFESVSEVAAGITPVPGGVGPLTVALLMKNTFEAFKKLRIKQ